MLPSVDPTGRITGRMATVYAVALLPLCAASAWTGVSGSTFLLLSLGMTLLFAAQAARLAARRSIPAARRLFLASILYLPLLLGVMVADMDDRLARGAFLGRQPGASVAASASPVSPAAPSGAVPAAWQR
jgi:heme O synthase-like polyprenyltransferase